jgi:DNA-binding CsgD family transcriptional regulator
MEGKILFAELGDRWGISVADFNLGEIALHQKKFQLAGAFYKESLIIRREMGDKKGIAYCLEGLACLAVEGSAVERGARLFSAAKSLRNSVSAPLSEGERASYEPYIERACIYLGEESFAAIMKSGGELSTDQVIQVELTALERDEKRRGQQAQPHPAGLTKREVEVLRLVAEGLSDARIAEELVISPRTVNAHITSIYSKLGVKSRATATHLAIDEGLV